MATVSLTNVSTNPTGKKSGAQVALQGCSVEFENREFVVLAGPAGCGNTTVLRLIAGLDEITGGDIFIDGRRVNDTSLKDRDLAMVFHDDALYPCMTVFENMALGLKLRKYPKPEIEKRVREAAEILDIGGLLDHRPRALTGIERRRAALGRAMARKPRVFLLDEPLTGLGAEERAELRMEIAKLHQRLDATFVCATCDDADALAMAGRIVATKDGVIQQTSPTAEIHDCPANIFVAGFFGSPRMNFIKGTLKTAGDGVVFREAGGGVVECKLPQHAGARAFAGRDVMLGIRAADVRAVAADGRPVGDRLQALVDYVEPSGAETFVHMQTGSHILICRSAGHISHTEHGRRMQFEIDVAKAHLFDPETTLRIME
jgi:multiple sugar transport system ATP-binding protein